jgi:3-oxoacyl-[acyl-carrier protein] reductase
MSVEKNIRSNRALITGGTDGIGLATAKLLLKQGYQVFICGRKKTKLKSALDKLKGTNSKRNVSGVICDVRELESVSVMFNEAISFMGGIDILINNAGVGVVAPIEELSTEEWNSMVDTNLTGVFNCCKIAIHELKKSKNAHIINLGSRAGRYAFAGGIAYNATKAGLQGFSEALFLDLSKYNIGVSLVAPGTVVTALSGVENKDWYLYPDDIAKVISDILSSHFRANINWLEIRPRLKNNK